MRFGLTCALVALLTPFAHANELSIKERVYARTLGEALGQRVVSAVPSPGPNEAKGLVVTLENGVVVQRHRYADPNAAIDALAGGVQDPGAPPALTQVRGRQGVVVRGPGVTDPVIARQMLDAAWDYLPSSKTPLMTKLFDGDASAGVTTPNGTMHNALLSALTLAQTDPRIKDLGSGLYAIDPGSFVFHIHPEGGSFVNAHDPIKAQELILNLEALTGLDTPLERAFLPSPTAAPAPTPGAGLAPGEWTTDEPTPRKVTVALDEAMKAQGVHQLTIDQGPDQPPIKLMAKLTDDGKLMTSRLVPRYANARGAAGALDQEVVGWTTPEQVQLGSYHRDGNRWVADGPVDDGGTPVSAFVLP